MADKPESLLCPDVLGRRQTLGFSKRLLSRGLRAAHRSASPEIAFRFHRCKEALGIRRQIRLPPYLPPSLPPRRPFVQIHLQSPLSRWLLFYSLRRATSAPPRPSSNQCWRRVVSVVSISTDAADPGAALCFSLRPLLYSRLKLFFSCSLKHHEPLIGNQR